ncbi:unnamed protein product [Darwinula stevensoni]|uniref:Uncharacterized protein n=1 Tax=Darwinula stevensoni TaxID=69355 RepID=A0A7R9A857_9CRUS|nr:unnamed protein product [Darwinula stevensoni]CAG0895620.1 unnamed protein product [Darwinula stevensoni]
MPVVAVREDSESELCRPETPGKLCHSIAVPQYKDVVIVGNGPSAITLSYMLAGNWPYYRGTPVQDIFLQERLRGVMGKSLLEVDLEDLSQGLEGRSRNPISLLYDALVHPGADLGKDRGTTLRWRFKPNKVVDHVALGRGLPGGSWQSMNESALTISFGSWMDLPKFKFREWQFRKMPTTAQEGRATIGDVSQYYLDYVVHQGLKPHFLNNTLVTCAFQRTEPTETESDSPPFWEVHGQSEDGPVRYVTPHLVLACGTSDKPNRLDIPGEDLSFVVHTLKELEESFERRGRLEELMVVGAGLSAADAIIAALRRGIKVKHVFRRAANDPGLVFNSLPPALYPEYHRVYSMMKSGSTENYRCFPRSKLIGIRSNGIALVEGVHGCGKIPVSCVALLIGTKPDLGFLDPEIWEALSAGAHPKFGRLSLDVDALTMESRCFPGLYALGPLAGDNFVRFIQGGALAVAKRIHENLGNIPKALPSPADKDSSIPVPRACDVKCPTP